MRDTSHSRHESGRSCLGCSSLFRRGALCIKRYPLSGVSGSCGDAWLRGTRPPRWIQLQAVSGKTSGTGARRTTAEPHRVASTCLKACPGEESGVIRAKSQSRLLRKVDVQLSVLAENSFMDRAENVLVWQSSKREKLLALCPRPTDAVPGPAGTLRLRAAKAWGNAGAIQLVSP